MPLKYHAVVLPKAIDYSQDQKTSCSRQLIRIFSRPSFQGSPENNPEIHPE